MPQDPLTSLGPIFRWSEAQHAGLSDPVLYRLLKEGAIERIGHGLYLQAGADSLDLDLAEIAAASPLATLCLTSALARHDLTDHIPARIDAALPRSKRLPAVSAPVKWHRFSDATFHIGRENLDLGGIAIGLYTAERSIIDAYRLRHQEGAELGREALKRWLKLRGSQPSSLLAMAKSFPKAAPQLRADLELLL